MSSTNGSIIAHFHETAYKQLAHYNYSKYMFLSPAYKQLAHYNYSKYTFLSLAYKLAQNIGYLAIRLLPLQQLNFNVLIQNLLR